MPGVHARQSLRLAMIARVTGLATAGSNVFATRKGLDESELPGIVVLIASDVIDSGGTATSGRLLLRRLETVQFVLIATSIAQLELMTAEVEAAVATPTSAHMRLQRTDFDPIAEEGRRDFVSATLAYEAEMYTEEGTPDVLVGDPIV